MLAKAAVFAGLRPDGQKRIARLAKSWSQSNIERAIKVFCDEHKISTKRLYSSSRKQKVVELRRMLSYFLRKEAGLSLQQAGTVLSIHHTSVLFHIRAFQGFYEVEKGFRPFTINVWIP